MAQTDSNIQYIFLPPVFETVSEKVMVKPAKIGWRKVQMSAEEARGFFCQPGDCKKWSSFEIPAQYETVTYKILKENSKKLIYHPPVFETVRDSVMVKPSMGKWTKVGKVLEAWQCMCFGDDCPRWEFIESPAEYQIVNRQILKSPAYFEDPSMANEEKTEVFEESQIAEQVSFKKSIEVQNAHTPLQFYPNPASDLVNIEVQAPIAELFVTDFAGKTLLRFQELNEKISFSVSTFPSGIYFLRYPDGNFWRSERLVVVR